MSILDIHCCIPTSIQSYPLPSIRFPPQMDSFNSSSTGENSGQHETTNGKRLLTLSSDSLSDSLANSGTKKRQKAIDQASENKSGPVSSTKRTPTSRAALAYQRHRSLTACQTCRQRKIKCDNVRPVCGSCQKYQASSNSNFPPCTYSDSKTDYSSFDRASLEILQKLSSIEAAIKELSNHCTDQGNQAQVPTPPNSASVIGLSNNTLPNNAESKQVKTFLNQLSERLDHVAENAITSIGSCTIIPQTFAKWDTSIERILDWEPISNQLSSFIQPQKRVCVLLDELLTLLLTNDPKTIGIADFTISNTQKNLTVLQDPLSNTMNAVSISRQLYPNTKSLEIASSNDIGRLRSLTQLLQESLPNLHLHNLERLINFEQYLFAHIQRLISKVFMNEVYPHNPFIDSTTLLASVKQLCLSYQDFCHCNADNAAISCFLLNYRTPNNEHTPLPVILLCVALAIIAQDKLPISAVSNTQATSDSYKLGYTCFEIALQLQSIIQSSHIIVPLYSTSRSTAIQNIISLSGAGNNEAGYCALPMGQTTPVKPYSLWNVQFNLLASVYQWYIMRPLAAWHYLQKACSKIIMYLNVTDVTFGVLKATPESMLVLKLYWFCFKFELQVKNYLSPFYVNSGIFQYDLEPKLSSEVFYSVKHISHDLHRIHTINTMDWYLTSTENQIMNKFYGCSSNGNSNVSSMQAESWNTFGEEYLKEQISFYLNQIQQPISRLNIPDLKVMLENGIYNDCKINVPEYVISMKRKIISMKIKLYQPLLYYILALSNFPKLPGTEDPASSYCRHFSRSVNSYMKDFATCLLANSDEQYDTTRTYDTWFRLREDYASVVLLLIIYGNFKELWFTRAALTAKYEDVTSIFSYWTLECPELGTFAKNIDTLVEVYL